MDFMDFNEYEITGNQVLLNLPKALILNSRQSKTPFGGCEWVKKTVEAVKYAVGRRMPVISSVGMNTWEIILWATQNYGGNGIVILPFEKNDNPHGLIDSISNDFCLNKDDFAFVFVHSGNESRSRKSWWESRDRLAFNIADYIFPVSVRRDGKWINFINSTNAQFKEIEYSYKARYEPKMKEVKANENILKDIYRCENWEWLTHWTRKFYGPWPGERSCDFYRALVASESDYPRKASDTLKKIISERLLRGSSSRIRGGTNVVAFTSLEPSDAVKLMKWRSRYVRYTFEPYGIAIHKEAALNIGIKPVRYVKGNEDTPDVDIGFVQGYDKGNWSMESEWRYIGDLDLGMFDKDDIRVIVPKTKEIQDFQSVSPFKIIALDNLEDISG